MPKVIFKFDKEKDLWNHWHKSNYNSRWKDFKIPYKTRALCKDKNFEECKEKLIFSLQDLHKSPFIKIHINSVKESWKIIEKKFFKKMDNLFNRKYNKKITAYLTTLDVCPYNHEEPSFMFSLFYSPLKCLQVCGHEIMHLYFHEFYWENIEKEIGKKKTEDLKESLTVLLNLEFRDLWFVRDKGYNLHKELRKFISDEWKEKKDLDILIKKCIGHLKVS